MEVFGDHWTDHFDRIAGDWRSRVAEDDLVLIPGDISWAMHLSDALNDLYAIDDLPGHKVILRGNHDYWWHSISRVRSAIPRRMSAIQNDCMCFPDVLIAGTRGWNLPESDGDAASLKIYERELIRLQMTLSAARGISDTLPLVVMMHFPPLTLNRQATGFTDLLEYYHAAHVVYGHLHGSALSGAFRGILRGVHYHQVSCDGLLFKLYELPMHALA